MTATLNELLAKKADLEKQIAEAQREEKSAAISQVKLLMAQHGLTLSDLGTRAPAPKKTPTGKVPAKFRNAATGESWSGRGLQPKWLKAALASGRSMSDFAL